MIRTIAASAALLTSLTYWTPSLADDVSPDYLIGYWGIGSPDECETRDTMTFFASGAWAVTNGGGNPVEVIGVWWVEGDQLFVDFAELDDPNDMNAVEATLSNVSENQFTATSPILPDGSEIMYRCSGGDAVEPPVSQKAGSAQ
ncbi:MAG: hypothetical protein AAF414_04910 [Pseudomonadota bacterium]